MKPKEINSCEPYGLREQEQIGGTTRITGAKVMRSMASLGMGLCLYPWCAGLRMLVLPAV